ncbi:MAG: phosphate ABC transporter permease subunit PstC [Thermosynechococcaceae cyanobacterium MS004]|nr:phosphate ABC transporter permease subunit PstC [Thermosynechococcaceae cyanobacterium MS004]
MVTQLAKPTQLVQSGSNPGQILDNIFIWITRLFAFSIALILVLITIEVGTEAIPAIQTFGLSFIFQQSWDPVRDNYGVLPMIYGTMMTSFVALLLAIPIGVSSAIFLSEDFLPVSFRTVLVFLVELLAAIPSVVYGLWGIFVLIPLIRPLSEWLHQTLGWIPFFGTSPGGPGLLPAGLVVTIMILPTITAISRDALTSLPPELRQASIGLGATRWETIIRVLLPAAFSGIVGAIMLALGRAMGETMAVTMLIGNSNNINVSLFAPGNTISSLLANQFAEASGLQVSALMYAGLILFALTLFVNIAAQWVVGKIQKF